MASMTIQPKLDSVAEQLIFKYPFRISHGVRTRTDVVLIKLSADGLFGLGEATLPPYLPWKIEDVLALFREVQVSIKMTVPHPTWAASDPRIFSCPPATAAIDMAVWNLTSAIRETSLEKLVGYPKHEIPHTFTLGISDKKEMAEKMDYARSEGFTLFKLKMDALHSHSMFENFRALSDAPFAVDANQGWHYNTETTAFAQLLAKNGCILLEQPFEKTDHNAHRKLRETLNIPVIADESIQNLSDLEQWFDCYDGINIKLQKCGGITAAIQIIEKAQELKKELLIGCMSESSIGCGSAEALVSRAQWADLDGPWLISNNDLILERASLL
ncbi:MAG: hypothetical protein RLZZ262_2067 [Bacteroidota bacterium]